MREPLIFPLGKLVGTYHDGGRHHEVRVGNRVENLADTDLVAWLCAHGQPAAVPAGDDAAPDEPTPLTAPALLRFLARQPGFPKPAPVVDALSERGLLVEVGRSADGLAAFARAHRVVPTMQGLGNTPEDPWMYSIGVLGQERIQVSRLVFEIWAWSHRDDNLWRACEVIAALEGDDVTGPADVVAGFVSGLHGLLDAQAAYIDPSGERP